MRSNSGYASIWFILLHQLQPRDMMAPITQRMPNVTVERYDGIRHTSGDRSHRIIDVGIGRVVTSDMMASIIRGMPNDVCKTMAILH